MPSASCSAVPVTALPLRAQRFGQLLPRRQPVAQAGQRDLPVAAQQAAEDPRRGGEDRGVMAAQQERQRLDRDARGGDERGGPDGPGVQQAGAQREGPVEGAGMHQPVLGRQAVPALHHHPPRPDRAMGMGHGLGLPRRAGGEDEIGQPVGIARDDVSRGVLHHRGKLGEDRNPGRSGRAMPGAARIAAGATKRARRVISPPSARRRWAPARGRRRRRRGRPRGNPPCCRAAGAPGPRVAGHAPERARHAEHGTGQARIAPPFGARGPSTASAIFSGSRGRRPGHGRQG
jgi:hypothetical protein